MTRLSSIAVAVAAAATLANQSADGHIMQTFPISRQYSYGPVFKDWQFPDIEYCPHCYNARGPDAVRKRAEKDTDPAELAKYGGGSFPLLHTPRAPNGNYLETDKLAVRHGICGDPEQNAAEGTNTYSTPNKNWEVLDTFQSGKVIEMDIIMNAYHWGHCEFFICNTADMDDPEGIANQECFNKHPLDRAPDDGSASPIDPNYPGRYYVDPQCRGKETAQGKETKAPDGYNIKMRYTLPDIECEHCVLQMVYYTGNSCKHIGYDEFEPGSWPGQCASSKDKWVELNRSICGEGDAYPEEFWACSDISISSDGTTPSPPPPPLDDGDDDHDDDGDDDDDDDDDDSMSGGDDDAYPTPAPTAEETDPKMPPAPEDPKMTPAPEDPKMTPAPEDPKMTPAPENPKMTPAPEDPKMTPAPEDPKMTPAPEDPKMTPAPTPKGTDPEESESMDPAEGGYEHVGCFADDKGDRVLGSRLTSDDMTAEVCLAHCNMRRAAYMATQHGNECWCSAEGGLDFERHGFGRCDKMCSGDNTETCGGYNAFDLYKLDWPEPSSSPEYMDCFADDRSDRVMGDMLVLDTMSTEACREHCSDKNAMYYGTQYSKECWCGTSDVFSDYERHGEGVCHMACSGDPDTACGGLHAFSLFRYMDDNTPTTKPVEPTMEPTVKPTEDGGCTGDRVEAWEQCGGDTYKGSSCCIDGYECTVMGAGTCYSQCRPVAMPKDDESKEDEGDKGDY